MKDPGMLQLLMATDPKQLARLPDAPMDKALTDLQQLKRTRAATDTPKAPAPATPPAGEAEANTGGEAQPAMEEVLGGPMADLVTHVWRAQSKMLDPESGEPREETRRIYRHIEGAMDTFRQMGLRINDWLNQPYDAGLPVKVISFQPTPDLVRDTVIEAVRPAVFWQDRLLQVGEVVVGIPQNTHQQP